MTVTYDAQADAVYVTLRDVPYALGHNLDLERRVDYGADHRPRGIELLGVSHGVDVRGLPEQAAVGRLLEEYKIRILA